MSDVQRDPAESMFGREGLLPLVRIMSAYGAAAVGKADFGQNTDGSLVLNPLQGLAAGAVSPSTLAWPITPSLGQIATF